ncbi:nucleotidyltransferase family protein [Sphingomonas sp. TX0543]|uniref:nucleotidyltransferase family protein n=1 Tax=Sphingomonas sp. TX0543 TaxID=3399682 RepID=UPI003AFAA0C1
MALYALLLAAGEGRRFGGGKLTALHRGMPLVQHALSAAVRAPVKEIIVVLGADAEGVGRAVAQSAVSVPVRMIIASDWAAGMSASLRAGVLALPEDAEGALVFLGDMPDVPGELASRLAAVVRSGAPAAVPAYLGQRGNPVLLGRTLLAKVGSLTGDRGARMLLADAKVVHTDDPGILRDVDVPADLESHGDHRLPRGAVPSR